MVPGKGGNEKLVSRLNKRRDELRRAAKPRQITGLQLVFLIREFYKIGEGETVTYEISALVT